jgi:hypothetical protein
MWVLTTILHPTFGHNTSHLRRQEFQEGARDVVNTERSIDDTNQSIEEAKKRMYSAAVENWKSREIIRENR